MASLSLFAAALAVSFHDGSHEAPVPALVPAGTSAQAFSVPPDSVRPDEGSNESSLSNDTAAQTSLSAPAPSDSPPSGDGSMQNASSPAGNSTASASLLSSPSPCSNWTWPFGCPGDGNGSSASASASATSSASASSMLAAAPQWSNWTPFASPYPVYPCNDWTWPFGCPGSNDSSASANASANASASASTSADASASTSVAAGGSGAAQHHEALAAAQHARLAMLSGAAPRAIPFSAAIVLKETTYEERLAACEKLMPAVCRQSCQGVCGSIEGTWTDMKVSSQSAAEGARSNESCKEVAKQNLDIYGRPGPRAQQMSCGAPDLAKRFVEVETCDDLSRLGVDWCDSLLSGPSSGAFLVVPLVVVSVLLVVCCMACACLRLKRLKERERTREKLKDQSAAKKGGKEADADYYSEYEDDEYQYYEDSVGAPAASSSKSFKKRDEASKPQLPTSATEADGAFVSQSKATTTMTTTTTTTKTKDPSLGGNTEYEYYEYSVRSDEGSEAIGATRSFRADQNDKNQARI